MMGRLLALAACCGAAQALLTMPNYFADGLVLQTWNRYHVAAKLYGTAEPFELVNATTDVASWPFMATVADAAGTWSITYNLPPGTVPASGFTLTITGNASAAPLVFKGVQWGDVVVCLGDSSVLLPLAKADNASSWMEDKAVAGLLASGNLRLFAAGAAPASTPQYNFSSSSAPCTWPGADPSGLLPCNTWVTANASNVAPFSAMCLQTVAALATSQGGTPGNSVVGLVQLAAPTASWPSLLPPSTNTTGCPTLVDPSPHPVPVSGLYNGLVAPIVQQTWRSLVLSTAGSDLPLVAASPPGAYSCALSAGLAALRARPGIGDYPVLMPLAQPGAAAGTGQDGDALFTMQAEQQAVLPRPGGSTDTVATALVPDQPASYLLPAAGAAPAPTSTQTLASRLSLAWDYTGYWNFKQKAVGPRALSAGSSGPSGVVAVSFAFAPDGNASLPHLGLAPVQGCTTCCSTAPATYNRVVTTAAQPGGPWYTTALALSADNTTLLVTPAPANGPARYVRYGAADPTAPECVVVDTTTGLPAQPFLLAVRAGPMVLEEEVDASSSATPASAAAEAMAPPPSPLPPASAHLVRPDGSFDRREYLLHGRERARQTAARLTTLTATTAAGAGGAHYNGSAPLPPSTLAQLYPGLISPTPPMGWNSWQAFRCNMDEALLLRIGQALLSSGLASLGYRTVNMDDCVMRARLGNGSLTEDETRFPSTLFSVGSGLARLGLGFGVYTSQTSETCVGRPGTYEYEGVDTARWCAWGATYAKVDNCGGSKWPALNTSWIRIRQGLTQSCGGRGVILSVETCGDPKPSGCGGWIRSSGATLWRTTADLQLYWQSVMANLDGNEVMAPLAGPGAYNDPDMLIVGHAGLIDQEARSHMGGWAISAAPLLLSFDLSSPTLLTPQTLATIGNPEVLAVDQDPAVVQGVRVSPANATGPECWARPVTAAGGNATAVFLLNRGAVPLDVSCSWAEVAPGVLGPTSPAKVRDLWARQDLGTFTGGFTAQAVQPHASMLISVVPA